MQVREVSKAHPRMSKRRSSSTRSTRCSLWTTQPLASSVIPGLPGCCLRRLDVFPRPWPCGACSALANSYRQAQTPLTKRTLKNTSFWLHYNLLVLLVVMELLNRFLRFLRRSRTLADFEGKNHEDRGKTQCFREKNGRSGRAFGC